MAAVVPVPAVLLGGCFTPLGARGRSPVALHHPRGPDRSTGHDACCFLDVFIK